MINELERSAGAGYRRFSTPSDTALTYHLYVQEIGRSPSLPSFQTERCDLDSYLLLFLESGSGKLSYAQKTFRLISGQVLFIDCRHPHHYVPLEENWHQISWVHLNGHAISGYYQQYTMQGSPVRTLTPHHPIPVIMEQLLTIQQTPSAQNEWLSSLYLTQLLTELLMTACPLSTTLGMPDAIKQTLQLIETRYSERLTLDYLAEQSAVNKYHLAKVFKRYLGYSPGEYIIRTRINYAKERLVYTGDSIAEIARLVGFDNVSHFINMFKLRVNQTPLTFRKNWQNEFIHHPVWRFP